MGRGGRGGMSDGMLSKDVMGLDNKLGQWMRLISSRIGYTHLPYRMTAPTEVGRSSRTESHGDGI